LQRQFFEFRAADFEFGEILRGRRHSLAARHQVIPAVARLHLDLVAEVAQLLYFFKQNQFNVVSPG
jgi:hypothetical protein